MSDLLQVSDLERAKLHDTFHSEVITGKAGGVSAGANIDYATNAVTGQVQKTLPKVIDDLDWSYVGLFADGVTFTDKTDFAVDAVGTQWIYMGSLPFSAIAGTVPSEPLYQVVHVRDHNSLSNRNAAGAHDALAISRGTSNVDADLTAVESDVESTNLEISSIKITNNQNAQPLMTRSSKVLSDGKGVVILGDSISAGAYFGNAWTNGWPYLLAKSVNHQFGARNVGTQPTDSLYNVVASYNTNQIHDVIWGGNWGARAAVPAPYDNPLGNVGLAAGDAVNGKTVVSSELGAYMDVTIPSLNKTCTIFYVGRVDGGSMDVEVNGVSVGTLDTSAVSLVYNKTFVVSVPDNGRGETNFRLTKLDASPTEIQTIIKYQSGTFDLFDHYKAMSVANYSISGRQLARTSEQAIIKAANCACLVLALGYNDRFAETDDVYYADFLQRIAWVVKHANVNKCLVIVADFCWYSAPDSRVRTELKRVATETNGIYIPFPDKLYPDGSIAVNTSPAASELVGTLRLWADNAHPNFKGNEMIFHEISKAMGLHITDKASALKADMPFPLVLNAAVRNKAPYISSAKYTSSGINIALSVEKNTGGPISAGTNAISTIHPKMNLESFFKSTKQFGLSSEAVKGVLYVGTTGSITMINTNPLSIEETVSAQTSFFS